MTANKRRFSWGAVLLVLLAMCLVYYLASGLRSQDAVSYAQVRQLFLDEKVQEFAISDTRLTAKLSDGSTVSCDLYDFQVFYDDLNDLVQQQHDQGIIRDYTYHADHSTNWLQLLLPYVLVILGFILLMNLMARMTGAGPGGAQDRMSHFGDARVQDTPQDSKVTFQDVAGEDEEKEELREIVEFLRQPDKYLALGARIPKGVLLVGPPGTGKTLLAKAVAGEAGVKFLSISGSDFVEMYVGVGASRVRDLFRQAEQNSPAIIFIDEIDAVGRQRGSGLGGGHDEREQTLNQLLVEMDGFTANEGVVVLAATNRVDILDPALLRPGRFDRQVYVGLPDIKGRRDILAVHARNKPLAEDVDLDKLAKGTSGFTGADLENLLNEAALLAGRRDEKAITMDDLQKSVIKVIAGPEKHSRVIPEHERRLTAYHEAGHAVVMHALPDLDPVHQITIVPRGQAGGMTIYRTRTGRTSPAAICWTTSPDCWAAGRQSSWCWGISPPALPTISAGPPRWPGRWWGPTACPTAWATRPSTPDATRCSSASPWPRPAPIPRRRRRRWIRRSAASWTRPMAAAGKSWSSIAPSWTRWPSSCCSMRP